MVRINNLALNLIRPPTIIPQRIRTHAHIPLSKRKRLTIIQRLNRRKLFNVLLKQVGQLEQQLATVLGRHLSPFALKGCACRLDG
jgi:hypothetical protein